MGRLCSTLETISLAAVETQIGDALRKSGTGCCWFVLKWDRLQAEVMRE